MYELGESDRELVRLWAWEQFGPREIAVVLHAIGDLLGNVHPCRQEIRSLDAEPPLVAVVLGRCVCHARAVDLFDEIAAERRGLADLLSGLTGAQQMTPSLCSEWTIRDVVGHLVVPLEVGLPRFGLAIVRARGNFDKANVRLARQQAQRPFDEIVGVLRRKADKRFTPPGMGPEAPLADVLVHGLDIRWPLGLNREIPQDRILNSLQFVADAGGGNVVPKGVLDGLRFEATDLDFAHGTGPSVSGRAEAVLLAMAGRPGALEQLEGEGVETLATRLV